MNYEIENVSVTGESEIFSSFTFSTLLIQGDICFIIIGTSVLFKGE